MSYVTILRRLRARSNARNSAHSRECVPVLLESLWHCCGEGCGESGEGKFESMKGKQSVPFFWGNDVVRIFGTALCGTGVVRDNVVTLFPSLISISPINSIGN